MLVLGIPRPPARRYPLAPILSIQAIEFVTGIGLTLLGSGLPAIAAWWSLNDARCGRLLLAVFAGSALGALFVRAPFHYSLALGLALTAASTLALALSGGHALWFLFLLFGLGIGLAMTANSILTGDRYPERRAAMLTLLNFSWSAGAAVSPFAIRGMMHRAGIPALFWAMAVASGLATALALALREGREAPRPAAQPEQAGASLRVIVFFAIFGLLYCGTEAALGSWLLTYVHRLGFHAEFAAPAAASIFWLSLLIGRAVSPPVLLCMPEDRLLAVALPAAFTGVALLLTLRSLPAVIFATALAGFSMAPLFPICSAIFMALTHDPAQARWMFAVAGMGSATFPWITGLLSARASLHTGLLVPLAGLGLMFLMMRWPGGGMDLFRAFRRSAATFQAASQSPLSS